MASILSIEAAALATFDRTVSNEKHLQYAGFLAVVPKQCSAAADSVIPMSAPSSAIARIAKPSFNRLFARTTD